MYHHYQLVRQSPLITNPHFPSIVWYRLARRLEAYSAFPDYDGDGDGDESDGDHDDDHDDKDGHDDDDHDNGDHDDIIWFWNLLQ